MREGFVIGTRGSRLALSQAELITEHLRKAFPDLAIRTQIIRTTGDRHPDLSIGELSGVGFFVKELELALLNGTIDAAVHSMKDLPSTETPGLVIAAIAQRDDPRDALVARADATVQTLPRAARVGTSSVRRASCLLALRADLTIVPMRGNVDTRVKKVDDGEVDAVCLAAAGLRRVGLDHRITQWFSIEEMLPAPGQGALGVQMSEKDSRRQQVAAAVDHAPTRIAVLAERIVLRRLEAGCRLPLAAYATVGDDRISVRAAVMSPDGARRLSVEHEGLRHEWQTVAALAAEDLFAQGAGLLAAAGIGR
ncbi:MAG: hydroxymethylbilane synthase [bacterium]